MVDLNTELLVWYVSLESIKRSKLNEPDLTIIEMCDVIFSDLDWNKE